MIRIEFVSPCGMKGFEVGNVMLPDKLGTEIWIEVSRGDSAGEGMTISNEQFFALLENFYEENF